MKWPEVSRLKYQHLGRRITSFVFSSWKFISNVCFSVSSRALSAAGRTITHVLRRISTRPATVPFIYSSLSLSDSNFFLLLTQKPPNRGTGSARAASLSVMWNSKPRNMRPGKYYNLYFLTNKNTRRWIRQRFLKLACIIRETAINMK